jgi:hypothetical protein
VLRPESLRPSPGTQRQRENAGASLRELSATGLFRLMEVVLARGTESVPAGTE